MKRLSLHGFPYWLWITLFAASLSFGGCSLLNFNEGAPEASRKIIVVANSIEKGDAVAAEIEKELGVQAVQPDTAAKGEAVAGTVGLIANAAAGIAAVIPGGQGVGLILGALGTLAGAVGTFMGRRKAAKIATAAVTAADKIPGGGTAMKDAATVAGVSADIRAALETKRASEA